MEYLLILINLFLIGLLGVKEFNHSKQLKEIIKDLTDKMKAKDLTEYSLYKQTEKISHKSSSTEPIKAEIQNFLDAYYYEKELEKKSDELLKELNNENGDRNTG
ncbi:MAG: hypothetical protein KatS3mg096_778 [Candidatus Parcubacteria bacterium]|nr:MAG: hypothetical protein KatS3mg096_778 [Candidatus Parcubacteria bacterium]